MSVPDIAVDVDTSTVTIAGVRFPAATLICPAHVERPDDDEAERALGAHGSYMLNGLGIDVYVPAENGLLFNVSLSPSGGGIELSLDAWSCEEHWDSDGSMWLPRSVVLSDGGLLPWKPRTSLRGHSYWLHAEPEWIVETIGRLSVKPWRDPCPGPKVKAVALSYFGPPTPPAG